MNAAIIAITSNTGQEILVNTPANGAKALDNNFGIPVKSNIFFIILNKLVPNTLLKTLLTAAIGAIKAQNAPPNIPKIPIA